MPITDELARKESAPPVLLTVADALMHSADKLDEMAAHASLAAMLLKALSEGELPGDGREKVDRLIRDMPEPDRQVAAMKAAARAIRELALEKRLSESRNFKIG